MKHISNPLLWLLLAFTLFFLGLGAVGFVGPDEPRYADVARGMMQSGDYVTPRLFGSPWFEKPPLYYWLAALFFHMGVNEVNARLPSALAACLFVWFWFTLSNRQFGTRTAALTSILLGSTLGWIGFAHAASMDMLFSATLDGALILLGIWFWQKQKQYLYGFYVLLALATLAKGPVAVVLAGLIALAYVVTYRDWETLWRTIYSPALSFFFVLAAPWYVFCYQRNGLAFVEEFIIKHNLGRYTSTALGHPQPVWFYLPIIAAGLFPWAPMLLLPITELLTRAGALFADRRKTFLFYWAATIFVFFSLSKNKLPSYVLPALPPLTLWIALIIEHGKFGESMELGSQESEAGSQKKGTARGSTALATGEHATALQVQSAVSEATYLQRLAVWLIGASAVLLLSLPLVTAVLGDSLATGLRHALASSNADHWWTPFRNGPVPPQAALLLLLPVGFGLFMLWRRNILEACLLVLVGVAMSMLGIVQYVSPAINRVASVRSVSQRLETLQIEANQLAIWQLHRNQSFGLSFYTGRLLPEWHPQDSPESISYVIAKDDARIADAQPMTLFIGQRLRLWALPPAQIEIHIENSKNSDE